MSCQYKLALIWQLMQLLNEADFPDEKILLI